MTLAEKFGWETPLAKYLSTLQTSYPDAEAHNFKDLLGIYKTDHEIVATRAVLDDDFDRARESAQASIRASMDWFFGDWRRSSPSKPNGIPYDWFCDAPIPLFWASALGDWKSVIALSGYPQKPPRWEWPDHAYYSLVGFFLRGEPLESHAPTVAYISEKKPKKPKLLLECLGALSRKDAPRFQNAWETYCEYFVGHERKQKQLDLLQSKDASFYVAAAKRYDVPLEIPERFKDYVIEFP